MSIIHTTPAISSSESFFSDLFSLQIKQIATHTNITMYLQTPTVTTSEISQTYTILQSILPSILKSTCFNDANLPFSKEVLQTEIGHLFEHILLEYLCEVKVTNGYKNPIHNGVTQWDWIRDKEGTFHIQIDAGTEDRHIFFQALSHSISLLEEILEYDPFRKRKKISPLPFSYQLN